VNIADVLRDALLSLRGDIEGGYTPWEKHGVTADAYEEFIGAAEAESLLPLIENALGDAIAYRLGDHDPNNGPAEPDDVKPYRAHRALAESLGLKPWY
jgi:hypothetical protein